MCRDCIPKLEKDNKRVASNQAMGPRCRGTTDRGRECCERFIAQELVPVKKHRYIWWSEWKCDVCEVDFLFDEKEKHYASCIKYKCNVKYCPTGKNKEFPDKEAFANHLMTECIGTELECNKTKTLVKRGEIAKHDPVAAMKKLIKSVQ